MVHLATYLHEHSYKCSRLLLTFLRFLIKMSNMENVQSFKGMVNDARYESEYEEFMTETKANLEKERHERNIESFEF